MGSDVKAIAPSLLSGMVSFLVATLVEDATLAMGCYIVLRALFHDATLDATPVIHIMLLL